MDTLTGKLSKSSACSRMGRGKPDYRDRVKQARSLQALEEDSRNRLPTLGDVDNKLCDPTYGALLRTRASITSQQ